MTFRAKIFISQLVLFILFILILFPFVETAITRIVHQSLQECLDSAAASHSQVKDLIHHFQAGFLIFSFLVLLIFSAMTWFIFNRLSSPIQKIIKTIKPYQEGKVEQIPQIPIKEAKAKDDFSKLALTINSLSERIQKHIHNLTEERNEKEAILESLVEGVTAVDAALNVRYVNFACSKFLGFPKRHLLGKPFPTEPSTPLLDKAKQLLTLSQERQSVLTDSLSIGKLYFDLIAAPIASGNGAILVLQDKSSNYKVLEMGKDFVANASHELRTPITIINGFAETLQDLPEISHEMLAEITEKIVRNCERMENLVKNLLTLADIENLPKTRFRISDLISIAENCRHILLSFYPEAQVEIVKNKPSIEISADPDLLELAIMNLLNNGAKYSKAPAHITINIQSTDDEVKISICDEGIGIPATDLEHIFERFYTVDKARSRRLGGAGLGLSIVKTIVQKHDGTISVESTVGKGTCFTMTLPI